MNLGLIAGDVERFRGVIERQLGLHFDDGKREFLADVLRQRLEKHAEDSAAYLRRLEKEAPRAEWSALGQLLTVPETYFFRHFDQFRAFADVALKDRVQAQYPGRRLSILSAGCASGEEAYSLAVMMQEAGMDATWNASILGVDINPAVIKKAAKGCYSTWALRETPADAQRKWFRPCGRDYVLDESIRSAVQFEERNLAESDPDFWRPGSYDIVFCRNMMMYFSAESARALIGRIATALLPGGYLFLGHAETLRGLSQDFHLCHTHDTFYYQRRTRVESRADPPISPSTPLQSPLAVVFDGSNSWIEAIRSSAERIQSLAQMPATAALNIEDNKSRWNLGQAFDLLRQERFADALSAIHDLPAEATNDADALLLKAVLCAHGGQLTEAEQVCRHLLDLDELNAGAHYVLALCREGAGDKRGAISCDQTAIYLDPAFAMPHLHLGLLARRANEQAPARRELEQAAALLKQEESSRLLLFGGGFGREALLALCRAELAACGGQS